MIYRPKSSKALIILVSVLLLANVGGIMFFLLNKPAEGKPGPGNERKNAMQAYLKSELGFSDVQMVAYDSLSARHRRYMSTVFDTMRREKERRLKYILENNFADTAVATAVAKTSVRQQQLEIKMLTHLREVRALCTPGQQAKFDTSIYKVFAKKPSALKKKPD